MVSGPESSLYACAACRRLVEGEDHQCLDFAAFFERIAAVATLIRAQLAYKIAADDQFAQRVFHAYSATAKLRAIKNIMEADSLEVH